MAAYTAEDFMTPGIIYDAYNYQVECQQLFMTLLSRPVTLIQPDTSAGVYTIPFPSLINVIERNIDALAANGYYGPRANTADDPANGIYVSPEGNDITATGSIGAPYKSINTALANAEPGNTIILRGGTYREGINVRVRIPNITIKSRKGEWAVIDLTTYNPGAEEDSGVYFDTDASGGKLQSVEVKGGFYAVALETKWGWHGDDDYVAASDIIIEDCKLHSSRYDVVKVKPNCNNVTIRYNEIYNSGQAYKAPFYGEDNAEGIDNVQGNNMIVQNNYIHDICSNAIYAKGGATDVLIENNIIERAYGGGILVGFDTSPDWFDLDTNPEYYENIRGVVRNNLIINTGWEGIGLYASKDAQIYNNTLVNVSNGLYHSAIYFGIATQDWDDDAGRPANINPTIRHNIVSQPASIVHPMIEIRFDDNDQLGLLSGLEGNPTMNNNCYYIAGKSARFKDNRPGSILENAGLSAWKAHIGGETGSIEVDPSLNSNYMPSNAQCAGMGIQHPLIVNDSPITGIRALSPKSLVYISNGILYIESPAAEMVHVYSINGALLHNLQKPAGKVSYLVNKSKGTEIIVRGSSGWSKKIIVR